MGGRGGGGMDGIDAWEVAMWRAQEFGDRSEPVYFSALPPRGSPVSLVVTSLSSNIRLWLFRISTQAFVAIGAFSW